jgi:imidazole glycerol-phosphate synthase subunit HisH
MNTKSILIPDFGIGNFASIIRMAEKSGYSCAIARQPEELMSADKIILAGVGAFDHGINALNEAGWREVLMNASFERKVPILGICLGMQMMCKKSEEGRLPGLGWIDADVLRFRFSDERSLRIPHMGWNTLSVCRDNPIILNVNDEQRFYFVHSYHVVCHEVEDVIATANYGGDFVAAFQHGNIFGVQFHPEKSHRYGMALLKRFFEL